jgi:hypothetical protein
MLLEEQRVIQILYGSGVCVTARQENPHADTGEPMQKIAKESHSCRSDERQTTEVHYHLLGKAFLALPYKFLNYLT